MIFAFAAISFADEGMWRYSEQNKRTQALCKSIVSIDFMGTGSLISPDGLVITNHHVAYSDVAAMSDKKKNYLEDGFWAATLGDEIPIRGRSVQILRESHDVTAEVQQLLDAGTVKPGLMMMRRLSGIMEKRWKEKTGYEAVLSSDWKGSKYYIDLYNEYKDIRLVGAPPSRLGAFGGDEDNWEWPQHKCDFALLRIYVAKDGSAATYSPENVPLHTDNYLKISAKGYREGSKTTIIGFPGHTDRYASSAKVDYMTSVQLPIQTGIRGAQMDIIKKWMDRDPEVRLKYSNFFFGLSNAQELYLGELQCYKRFGAAEAKREAEAELSAWLDEDPARRAEWGDPAGQLRKSYEAVAEPQRNFQYFRECIIRGTQLEPVATRTFILLGRYSPDKVPGVRKSTQRNYEQTDLRVERELFRMGLETFYEHVPDGLLGPWQKEVKEKWGRNYDGMCAALWDESWMTDPAQIAVFLDPGSDMKSFLEARSDDPLVRFFNDVRVSRYNEAISAAQGSPDINALAKDYTHAMYAMQLDKKRNPYPDANSTLRVNHGRVRGLSPRDAVHCDYYSTVAGLLEKHDPDSYDFCLPASWKAALEKASPKMKVNFITDNDSTGGNSGSPVLNSRGEIIGLLFDGNKESLASEVLFTPEYNRSVNVDIRFVVWTLKEYAHFDRIVNEIGL